jgi:hypothetical protein
MGLDDLETTPPEGTKKYSSGLRQHFTLTCSSCGVTVKVDSVTWGLCWLWNNYEHCDDKQIKSCDWYKIMKDGR